jgi:two-component system catabolic regulation response regulator CreB
VGREGLKAVKDRAVALIILDIGLPDINGFELFKEIKNLQDVPVIFLTARSEEVDRIVGLELGGDDYVTKPFSPRELTARVKAVLRRVAVKKEGPKDIGGKAFPKNFPFHCDDKKKVIFYFKQPVKTSKYEFEILRILIRHPGWVYSRDQLMEMVWDDPDVSLIRTVDTHIKNLRQKLKRINPDIDPIVTSFKSGYSLRENW